MKTFIILAVFACISGIAWASSNSSKADKVHSDVMSYVDDKHKGCVQMMRFNPVHLECYNEFLPRINFLAEDARHTSTYCVSDADELKDKALSELQEDRKEFDNYVKEMLGLLASCSIDEGLDYFICMDKKAEKSSAIMDQARQRLSQVLSEYRVKLTKIEQDEEMCHINTIDMAKLATDKAFNDLKSCISERFPANA